MIFKNLFLSIFLLYGCSFFGQQKKVLTPSYVIIANHKIISKAQLEAYAAQGNIKAIHKGVSELERNQLAKKLGNKIGDREFIIKVDLLSPKEKLKQQASVSPNPAKNLSPTDELKLKVNEYASNFTVPMIDGSTIQLSALKGKVVLVNYWATWCAPCLLEFTEMPNKILEPFKNKDFVFIPIAIGETKEKVAQKMLKMKKYGVDFNTGFDTSQKIWNQYATGSIPKNFVIDKNGKITYISVGNSEGSVDKLALEIKKLLSK